MMTLSRRLFLSAALASTSTLAFAQVKPASKPAGPKRLFDPNDVTKTAETLSKTAFVSSKKIADPLANLSFDQYRDIRFKSEKSIKIDAFKLQTFHSGFIYKDQISINLIKEGVVTPHNYSASNYDFGKNKLENASGHAGFRLHYPLNDPKQHDELISFLGASYFRFLGRAQFYGLSARGLVINSGTKETEEFPIFKEFWIEQAKNDAITIHALMDSPSLTGAYRFTVYPSDSTVLDVQATLFARKTVLKPGLAPLTSMFMKAENDRRVAGDFRPELHDSDGLLIHGSTGEWLWRPLRNPVMAETSVFLDKNVKGFGLMQRDRTFEHYQDLDLNYEHRPSYWVEPRDGFGTGRVELVELPTTDETNDNIVAFFVADKPLEAGQSLTFSYRITSTLKEATLHPGAKAINTFKTQAVALGSSEIAMKGTTRFIIDFAGGDLDFYIKNPDMVQIVPSVDTGKIIRTFLIPNKQIKGFRVGIDVAGDIGKTANLRAFLKTQDRTLSETWTFPWVIQ